MFFIVVFIVSIIIWSIFADKRRWRSLITISLISLLLAVFAQHLAQKYLVWDFIGDQDWVLISISNSSVYMVSTYLFIQWYPVGKDKLWVIGYWIAWTTYALIVEYIYWEMGHLVYYPNWSLWKSYIADWVLYGFFYIYYSTFKLEKLDKGND